LPKRASTTTLTGGRTGAENTSVTPATLIAPKLALEQHIMFQAKNHKQGFPLTSSVPVSAALSTGVWPCCDLLVELDGCTSNYHVEKVDKMEADGSPKGKGPRDSANSDGKQMDLHGQGDVMLYEPNGTMPLDLDGMRTFDSGFTNLQDWGFADPRE
jgi:hypothetical protein